MVRSALGKLAWVGWTASMVFGLALVLALVFGAASAALGANGGGFILGKATNVATRATGLIGKVAAGEALVVKNPSGGSALGLSVGDPLADPATKTVAPLKVDSQAKVANLNADKLDGMEPNRLPGGIAGVGQWAGPTPSIAGASSTWVFAGPQATVTTTGGQRLVGAAQAPLGLPSGAAPQYFNYSLCYQPSAGGALAEFSFNGYSVGQITPTRTSWSAPAATGPMNAGTWKVGFCVKNTGSAPISNNDWVNGWVQVINEPATPTAGAASKVATSNIQER